MPIYTIGTPDGRKLRIEAPDEATAIRGAQEWSASQSAPVPPPQPAMPEEQPIPEQGNMLGDMAGRLGQSVGSTMTGMVQGATLGAYDELAALLGSPIKGAENLLSGRDSIDGFGDVLPFLGRSFVDAQAGQQALVNQAYEQAPVSAIAGDAAGSVAFGLLSGGSNLINVAKPSIAGMAGRGAVEGSLMGAGTGYSGAEDPSLEGRLQGAAQGAVVGGALGAITGGLVGNSMSKAQRNAVPTVQELADDAGALYQAARASGVTASPQMTDGIANTIEGVARAENVILPSGRVNNTYPKIAGVLNIFDEYKGQPIDVGQMQSIRRSLQDAAKSIDPGERRVATIMLGEFDDFATGVAPELAEASNLYWRSKLGETIEEAIDLATNRSSQYSQSGMENALRTQFRQLNAKIIKGQLRGVPPELAEQIRLVADGSPIQNFARGVGKFAVRGPVSGVIPTLAAAAGFGVGGPVGAALGAGTVALPGEVGKRAAEGISIRNADVASAIARSGGALPSVALTPVSQALINSSGNFGGRMMPNF